MLLRLHTSSVYDYKIHFKSLHCGLTRVKIKEDTAPEPAEAPELMEPPNGIRHPSLTVAFALKVGL